MLKCSKAGISKGHMPTAFTKGKLSQTWMKTAEKLFMPVAGEDAIGLAVSGGVDSLALMVLVHGWLGEGKHDRAGPKVFVYSVDHGLRRQSVKECEEVGMLAKSFGFEHKTLVWQEKKPRTGVQEAAREARYGLIAGQMLRDKVGVLLSGHHMDDQAETVMMRLAHGSGVRGLRGMEVFSEIFGIRVFRPLLAVGRGELCDIVKHAGLEAFFDPSNEDPRYERVRWRKLLAGMKDSGLSAVNLSRLASRMGRAEQALEHFCSEQFTNNVEQDKFGVQMVSHEYLIAQPEEISIRLLGKMIYRGSGGRGFGRLSQLEGLLGELSGPEFHGVVVGGCGIALKRGKVVVFREAGRFVHGGSNVTEAGDILLHPGREILWDQRFIVRNISKDPVIVKNASSLSRKRLQDHVGNIDGLRMDWLRSCVMAVDEKGDMLAIGAKSLSKDIDCELAEFD